MPTEGAMLRLRALRAESFEPGPSWCLLDDSATLALRFDEGSPHGKRRLADFGYAYVLPSQRQKLAAPSARPECKAKERSPASRVGGLEEARRLVLVDRACLRARHRRRVDRIGDVAPCKIVTNGPPKRGAKNHKGVPNRLRSERFTLRAAALLKSREPRGQMRRRELCKRNAANMRGDREASPAPRSA